MFTFSLLISYTLSCEKAGQWVTKTVGFVFDCNVMTFALAVDANAHKCTADIYIPIPIHMYIYTDMYTAIQIQKCT